MNNQPTPDLLVIVPRAKSEACRRLQQTLDGPGVRVVLDRRSMDAASRPEDRRTRTDGEAALAAGKWIVVRDDAEQLDVFDPDARAILFLYCSNHAVPCERCQETYRLGWLIRSETALSCPQCRADLTPLVVAHALRCQNWEHRRPGARPPVRLEGRAPSRQAAAG